jgi:Rieske Fe-S protein
MNEPTSAGLTRRTVVVGTGAAGAGLFLAGCSTAAEPSSGADPGGPAAGTVLGPASEVPVGSAVIYGAEGVVVTRPTDGNFAAFSTVCPHQGCEISRVEDASVVCPCHGSTFALDGAVIEGPAETGLEARQVSVEDGQLTLA